MNKFIKPFAVLVSALVVLQGCDGTPDEQRQLYFQGEQNGKLVYTFPIAVSHPFIWTKVDAPVIQRQREVSITRISRTICPQGYEVTERTAFTRQQVRQRDYRTGLMHTVTSSRSSVTIACPA